jgi:hypothetical protein
MKQSSQMISLNHARFRQTLSHSFNKLNLLWGSEELHIPDGRSETIGDGRRKIGFADENAGEGIEFPVRVDKIAGDHLPAIRRGLASRIEVVPYEPARDRDNNTDHDF